MLRWLREIIGTTTEVRVASYWQTVVWECSEPQPTVPVVKIKAHLLPSHHWQTADPKYVGDRPAHQLVQADSEVMPVVPTYPFGQS